MLEHHPMRRSPGSRHERDGLVRTVCQECSVACGLVVSVKDRRIVDVQGDESHPVSRGRLCARGSAFVQGITSPERLTVPAAKRKRGDAFKPLEDWKSGVDLLAERLRQVKDRYGSDSLVIGCDREGGLDFHLGALRFARLWGTSQVFHSAADPLDPWPEGLDSPTAPCSEWVDSKCLLLVETDLAASHPVAFGWIQEAQRRGAQVVAADARFTATLAKANLALRMKPGQGNLLGLALAKLMIAEGGLDDRALAGAFANADAWRASLEQMSLDGADAALGISLGDLRHLAVLLLKHAPVTVITGRELIAQPHQRIWLTLAKAMGWIGRVGGGWYPVDAGTPVLAVQGDPGDGWVGPEGSRSTLGEVTERGNVQALICSGNALAEYVSPFGRLSDQAELVAHFGSFPNATWERASMTFPAALWAERDGLFFGGDRSVEWGRTIVEPPAGCRSGLDFWMELARRFGWEKHFPWATEDGRADHGAFYGWVLARSPAMVGVSLDEVRALEPGSRCFWPAGQSAHPAALRAGTIAVHPAPASLASGAGAPVESGYPLALVAARSSCRSGDASRFWSWTRNLTREDAVQIHPETAERLGIENGDEVLVDTPRGALPARANLSRVVSRRTIGSFQGVTGSALVRKKDQSADEARALLNELNP
jgi:anaerobic selenocysteine-containing dehydrogenase